VSNQTAGCFQARRSSTRSHKGSGAEITYSTLKGPQPPAILSPVGSLPPFRRTRSHSCDASRPTARGKQMAPKRTTLRLRAASARRAPGAASDQSRVISKLSPSPFRRFLRRFDLPGLQHRRSSPVELGAEGVQLRRRLLQAGRFLRARHCLPPHHLQRRRPVRSVRARPGQARRKTGWETVTATLPALFGLL